MSTAVPSYIAQAREDLAVADKLLADHPRHAAFHIEQAAEKLLKAVLTAEAIRFPTHHQLGALAALLPVDHPWRADLMAFDGFTAYATALRYPAPGGGMPAEPEDAELRRGLAEVAALLPTIDEWCGQRLGLP
jgi:HEPN domain-containing protein